MEFGQAFDEAGALLTLLGILIATPIMLMMTRNIGNPEFDMNAAFLEGIYGIVGAIMPALIPTLAVAVLIYLYE